jgi:hypothetical protein
MKVTIIEVPQADVQSFTMFAKPDLALLRETKKVRCSIHRVTKTRLSTDIHFGNFCGLINLPIEGYKLHEKSEMNYFSGKRNTSHYFVKSKTQDLQVYKKYLESLVGTILQMWGVELDEITVELETNNF